MSSENDFNVIHLNIRSLRKGFDEFITLITDVLQNTAIIILTDVSIGQESADLFGIPGFNMYTNLRINQRGGGVIMYVKEIYSYECNSFSGISYEMIHCKLKSLGRVTHILGMYRTHKCREMTYVRELDDLLQKISHQDYIIYIGDINIDIKSKSMICSTTREYEDVLCKYGLQCGIREFTREEILKGRLTQTCIDHMYARVNCESVSCVFVYV